MDCIASSVVSDRPPIKVDLDSRGKLRVLDPAMKKRMWSDPAVG